MRQEINIKQTVIDYVRGEVNDNPTIDNMVVLLRIGNAIEGIIKQKCFTGLELSWLRWNMDKLPKIVDSERCSAIFYLLYNLKSSTIQNIGRRMGIYTNSVRYWIKKLRYIDLLKTRKSHRGWGREVRYMMSSIGYPNVLNLLYEEICRQHSIPKLEKMTRVNKDIQRKSVDKSMWRR